MNSLETLYFPDTAIFSPRQATQLLLFSKVNMIAPSGNQKRESDGTSKTFMDSQYCHELDLHPLKQERDRFLYLINDIKNRKDDYAAQLSHLTLASYSQSDKRGDESKNQILSSLLGTDVKEENGLAKRQNELLWKSRLVLAIAQLLDQEEEELARSLAFLENSEMSIFSELKGEEGNLDLVNDLSDIKSKMATPKTDSVKNRIQSWFRFIDNSIIPTMNIWSCTRLEVAAHLFEHHEKIHKKEPEKLATLPIPAHIGKSTVEAIDGIALFHEDRKEVIARLNTLLCDTHTQDEIKELESLCSIWSESIDNHFPEKAFGRGTVEVFCFTSPLHNYCGFQLNSFSNSPQRLALFSI